MQLKIHAKDSAHKHWMPMAHHVLITLSMIGGGYLRGALTSHRSIPQSTDLGSWVQFTVIE